MTCPHCGTEMEPIPDVGYACLKCLRELAGGDKTLTIRVTTEGLAMDCDGMTNLAVLHILQFAYRLVTAQSIRAAHKAAQEN